MAKPIIQDVVPPQRKTIRDIPIPDSRKFKEVWKIEPRDLRHSNDLSADAGSGWKQPPAHPVFSFWDRLPKLPRMAWIGCALVALVAVIFLVSQAFSVSAMVSIVPKSKQIVVDSSFTAKKEAKSSELQFEIMTITREGMKTVPSTGEKKVEVKASGVIVIYNDYNAQPQRLIKNTRFETPEGLMYRIDRAVTVPGRTTVAGKAVPGAIEATVYADEPGEKHNINASDFTVPGFKGDPRFPKFYARSKTPMKGGVIGTVKTASSQDILKASQELDQTLRADLLKEASSQKPDGFILYEKGVFVEMETLSPSEASDLKKRGTLYAIIFDAQKLSRFLAERLVSDYDNSPVLGTTLHSLAFSPEPLDGKPWQKGTITFALKGQTTLSWIVDTGRLTQDLMSQPKERVSTILKAYPAIDTAEVTVRPFWRSTLPDDARRITVKGQGSAGETR